MEEKGRGRKGKRKGKRKRKEKVKEGEEEGEEDRKGTSHWRVYIMDTLEGVMPPTIIHYLPHGDTIGGLIPTKDIILTK